MKGALTVFLLQMSLHKKSEELVKGKLLCWEAERGLLSLTDLPTLLVLEFFSCLWRHSALLWLTAFLITCVCGFALWLCLVVIGRS